MNDGSIKEKGSALDGQIHVMNLSCGCETRGTMIYTCSGGSNVGQICNEAAKALVRQGIGKFACLAGLGMHGEGFVSNAHKAGRIIVLDGCGTKCAYKILKHVGIEPTIHLVITDHGVNKDYDHLDPMESDVERAVRFIVERL